MSRCVYDLFVPGWQAGDKVVYSKYAGTEVALDKTDYVLLKVSMC